jgi:mRNA interferase MazF
VNLDRGTVVLVALDPAHGHEQRGSRPCVVVTDAAVSTDQRFPMLAVVPLTGTPGEGALYPGVRPGHSGLRRPSWALVDQLRAVDKRRVAKVFGMVSLEELAAIDDGLRLFLGLG